MCQSLSLSRCWIGIRHRRLAVGGLQAQLYIRSCGHLLQNMCLPWCRQHIERFNLVGFGDSRDNNFCRSHLECLSKTSFGYISVWRGINPPVRNKNRSERGDFVVFYMSFLFACSLMNSNCVYKSIDDRVFANRPPCRFVIGCNTGRLRHQPRLWLVNSLIGVCSSLWRNKRHVEVVYK